MKKDLKELRGKLLSMYELDEKMMELGYYSIMDDGVIGDVKKDLNVIYTNATTHEAEIIIEFKIATDNGEEECEESFELIVLKVSFC